MRYSERKNDNLFPSFSLVINNNEIVIFQWTELTKQQLKTSTQKII